MLFDHANLKTKMAELGLATLVGGSRLSMLWSITILQGANRSYNMAEIGVYRGGSAFVISEALKQAKIIEPTFYMVDTFTGMPFVSEKDEGFHHVGEFGDLDYNKVKFSLEGIRENNKVFKGLLKPDFINHAPDLKYSFVHIDVDVYQSVIECLEYFWPRMMIGGMILLDDPHMSSCPGALKALNDFLPLVKDGSVSFKLPTRQAFLMRIK